MNPTGKNPVQSALLLLKRQFYKVKVKGICLHIDGRYKNLQPIGCGSYGIVCKAIDTVTGMNVAIKIIPLDVGMDISCLRCLREIKYLRFFQSCPEVVDLVDYYCYPYTTDINTPRDTCTLYMITKLYEFDLELVIDAKNYLSFDQIRLICYQLLLGVRTIHSAGFLHRDIKPANILLSSSADVAICDFGLARSDLAELTGYVVTRNYRAPELIVENRDYTNKIDIWSVGVVLGEMFHGSAMFSADSNQSLLEVILNTMGKPSEEDCNMIEKPEVREYVRNYQIHEGKSFRESFSREIPDDGFDLLMGLLAFNPNNRLSAQEALQHRFFNDLNRKTTNVLNLNRYELEWEEFLLNHYDKEHVWEAFVEEQRYYPLTKCKYMN